MILSNKVLVLVKLTNYSRDVNGLIISLEKDKNYVFVPYLCVFIQMTLENG